jgi:hypothetical protein
LGCVICEFGWGALQSAYAQCSGTIMRLQNVSEGSVLKCLYSEVRGLGVIHAQTCRATAAEDVSMLPVCLLYTYPLRNAHLCGRASRRWWGRTPTSFRTPAACRLTESSETSNNADLCTPSPKCSAPIFCSPAEVRVITCFRIFGIQSGRSNGVLRDTRVHCLPARTAFTVGTAFTVWHNYLRAPVTTLTVRSQIFPDPRSSLAGGRRD